MDSNTTTYTKTFSIDLERANYHLKCKKRKVKRIITIVVMWLLIIIYFVTPLSKVNLKIEGNVYYSKKELMDIAYISKHDFWWLVDEKNLIKVLESYEYINNVKIKKSFLGVKIEMDEIYPVGQKDGKYVLNSNNIIEKESYVFNSKIENITDFNSINDEDLNSVISKFSKINIQIRDNFNKVEIVKTIEDYSFIKLYCYEESIGYFVIKTDLVFLDTKFNENKYSKIIEEIKKNNVKYSEDKPCLVAYHYYNEEEFHLVENFEEE